MSIQASPHYSSIALMFPGQGSQFPGMAMDLVREIPKAREIVQKADDLLGYPLSKIMAGEKGSELDHTVHTQPAVFVHSVALLESLQERHSWSPIIAAGHSLGEYSALYAAGVLTFEDALDIIRIRAQGMNDAQPPGSCGMAAIIGLTKEEIQELVDECRGDQVLEAANFNAPDQIVVSGHMEAVNRMLAAVKGKRARAVMLPVSSAFHTLLMEPAKESLRNRLEQLVPGEAKFPVAANVTAEVYPTSQNEIKGLLIEQIVRPVLWDDCVRTMIKHGAKTFIEIGPGKVLAGLLRRIDKKVSAINISDLTSLDSFQGVSA